MNSVEVMALAMQLEVNLDVDGEREKLIAKPSRNITPELDAGLKGNKDELLRNLLIRQAASFLRSELYGSWEAKITGELADAYNDASFADFRKALKKWTADVLKAGRGSAFRDEEEVRYAFVEERDRRWKEVA